MRRPQVLDSSKDGLYFLCSRCVKNNDDGTMTSASVSFPCISVSLNVDKVPVKDRSYSTKECRLSNVSCSNHVSYTLVCNSSCYNKTDLSANVDVFTNTSDIFPGNNVDLLWHNRFGHVPYAKMRTIPTLPAKLSSKQLFVCTIYPMAR